MELIQKVSTRLRIRTYDVKTLPADVMGKLAVLTHQELCVVAQLGGMEAIRALVVRPHFNGDRAEDLTVALFRATLNEYLTKGSRGRSAAMRLHLAKGSVGRPRFKVSA